jgi:hypothetical protein
MKLDICKFKAITELTPVPVDYQSPGFFYGLMVFNTTFKNILAISWRSVLMVEETGGPEKSTDLSQVTDKFYHLALIEIRTYNVY